MPTSKTQGRNSSFDPSALWLSLNPYWQTIEKLALPAAERYLRRPFPKSEHYRFRERLHNALSGVDPDHRVPYTPLARYGFLLACYHRLRRVEALVSDSPTRRNLRKRTLEQRTAELVQEAYQSLTQDFERFLERY